jgi:precorrin-6A/cobalt-precorrin-6A reductase
MERPSPDNKLRILVLGGSSEATAIAGALSGRGDIDPILSFAGRTRSLRAPPIPFRVGGFGGVAGLRDFLTLQRIDLVIDATHPFAAQMSAHAASACRALAVPLAVFTRPAWRPAAGDRWIMVDSIEDAVRALDESPRRVFLTIGARHLAAFAAAPQHHYLVRAIEPPAAIAALPDHRLVLARGPFRAEDEIALMRENRIEVLVTKNSGGQAAEGKLEAARTLRLPVIMVKRPEIESATVLGNVAAVLAWIDAHRSAP